MISYGCRGIPLRSLSKSNAGIKYSLGILRGEVKESFLPPLWIYNANLMIQRNFKLGGGKDKKDKDCDDKKKKTPKSDGCCDDKKKKPPKDDGCCDTCPKERTELCKETIVCAKTGMKMPALILGTWKTDEFKVAQKALTTALKVGYRAIDTATFYGNEEVLGCAIPAALEEAKLKREDIFIITKLPFDAMRCEKVEEYLCKSLAQLKTPYIDLYMINFPAGSVKCDGKYKPDPRVDHTCIWKAMETAVECKKCKYIGLANFNCDQLEEIVNCSKIKPSNVQIEMHAYFQQKSYRKVAKELGCTVTAYAPFGRSEAMVKFMKEKGECDDKPSPINDPVICELAKKLCKSPQQILLRYLLQIDDNLAVVANASDPKFICANVDIYDFKLDDADLCQLRNLDKGKQGRLFNKSVFKLLFPGVQDHPLFPWPDC